MSRVPKACSANLLVTDSSNNVIYQSALTDPFVLDQFAAGTNVLPSIMDGGKRDRSDFTSDIGISGLTLLYSTFVRQYLEGSIELFSRYQRPDGRIATSLAPQYNPGVTPPTAVNAKLPCSSRITTSSTSPRFTTTTFTRVIGRFFKRNGRWCKK
jgi:hypothetical protein